MPQDLAVQLLQALELTESDLVRWGLGWARVAPSVLLIPAFGLRAVPVPTRVALGLCLAFFVVPALPASTSAPWELQLALELVRGLPVAITGATALWVAQMAGGLVDNLRGSQERVELPHLDPESTPSAALLSMLTAIIFLQTGGAERVATALMLSDPEPRAAALELVRTLTSGIHIAVAVAAPLVAVSLVVEVASALVARAANPAFLQPVLAPLRGLALLFVLALVLDRVLELLAQVVLRFP